MAFQFAIVVAAAIASVPLGAHAGQESAPATEPLETHFAYCGTGETLVFAGDVQDDFGLAIAVCVNDETLTIRYSGEGDPQAVSCRIGKCAGIIDFGHHVRYRLTIITLAWRDEKGEMKLIESFDAQNTDEEPIHIVSVIWSPAQAELGDIEPQGYQVVARTQPLSLVALSDWNWP
jgi:hypothetical protein